MRTLLILRRCPAAFFSMPIRFSSFFLQHKVDATFTQGNTRLVQGCGCNTHPAARLLAAACIAAVRWHARRGPARHAEQYSKAAA